MFKRLLFVSLLIIISLNFAFAAKVSEPSYQQKISSLTHSIDLLKKNIRNYQREKQRSTEALITIEKSISSIVEQLEKSSSAKKEMEQTLAILDKEINDLIYQLHQQQATLARFITWRYQLGNYPSLVELIIQNNFNEGVYYLDLYHYLIQHHQKAIAKVNALQAKLAAQKQSLMLQLAAYHQLQQRITVRQDRLMQQKLQRNDLILQLKTQILDSRQKLNQQEYNKQQLVKLLPRLALEQNTVSTHGLDKNHRLPLPLGAYPTQIKKKQQGLFFLAPEGVAVYTVAAGKVVFSDWLKGYGLLLIIDHGQGYMTLYAHNQALLKHRGQRVELNEKIAYCGRSGGLSTSGLYFEIRHLGKVLPALPWFKIS